jgi:DNA polymerase-3 subunit delta
LHFKQKDAFAGQCRAWTSERLAEALRRIAVAAKAARLSSSLEEALTERLLLSLAMMARSGTRSL